MRQDMLASDLFASIESPSREHWALGVVLIIAVYVGAKAFYRVYLHPLSKFPGPLLASLTHKYEFYYDGIKDGQYSKHIVELHKVYGPIVRIGPNELHCNDPAFVDQVYAGGRRRTNKTLMYESSQGYLSARVSHDELR